jgi:hypothetical protein
LETTSKVNSRTIVLSEVASSKGTEWMVSNYNAWQQRNPLPSIPETNDSSLLQMVNWMSQKEKQMNTVMAFSFRPILLLVGLIMSVKSR